MAGMRNSSYLPFTALFACILVYIRLQIVQNDYKIRLCDMFFGQDSQYAR